jgi:hypothetical protein
MSNHSVAPVRERQGYRLERLPLGERSVSSVWLLGKAATRTVIYLTVSNQEDLCSVTEDEEVHGPAHRCKYEFSARLCGVERSLCQRVLDALVDAKLLCVKLHVDVSGMEIRPGWRVARRWSDRG